MAAPLPLPDDLVSRRRYLASYPGPLVVEAEMVVGHIDALRRGGLTLREIARLSRRSVGQLRNLRRQQHTSRLIAISVIAIPVPPAGGVAPTDRVPAVFAQRVVRSWRLQGWTWRALADETGVCEAALRRLAYDGGMVTAGVERKVRTSIRALRRRDPIAECGFTAWRAAMRSAARSGWRPLWQYARPDDPGCEPVVTAAQARMVRVVSQTTGMAAAGFTRTQIVEAVGLAWDTIRTYHYRTGCRLPEVTR